MKKLSLILIIIFFVFVVNVFPKDWNGITPSVSTRAIVEKILGKEELQQLEFGIYKYKTFQVYIDYDRKDSKNFDKDIVRKIRVSLSRIQTLKNYIKRIPNFYKNFPKTEIDIKTSHIYGSAIYRNRSEGFEIWVYKDRDTDIEFISSFGYFAVR
jgi:hypothetical protein